MTRYIFAILLFVVTNFANATIITWEARGTLDNVDLSGGFITDLPTATVGTSFVFRFEFDSLSPLSNQSAGRGGNRYRYGDALTSVKVIVGATELQRDSNGFFNFIDVWDDFAFINSSQPPCADTTDSFCDGLSVAQNVASSQQGGFSQWSLVFRGTEHLNIYNGQGLPTDPSPLLLSLSTGIFQFVDETDFILGNIDSIERIFPQTIPEPATLGLLVVGLLGFLKKKQAS